MIRDMIRDAINAELARRASQSKPNPPATKYALAKQLGKHPQSIYRMLGDTRPSFLTEHADAMLEALELCIVQRSGSK